MRSKTINRCKRILSYSSEYVFFHLLTAKTNSHDRWPPGLAAYRTSTINIESDWKFIRRNAHLCGRVSSVRTCHVFHFQPNTRCRFICQRHVTGHVRFWTIAASRIYELPAVPFAFVGFGTWILDFDSSAAICHDRQTKKIMARWEKGSADRECVWRLAPRCAGHFYFAVVPDLERTSAFSPVCNLP